MANAKANLYAYVNRLRDNLGLSYESYPINTVELCSRMGNVDIQYHAFKSNGFCGAVLIGDISNTIILNSNRSESEINFDCGHETLHLTKHRAEGIDCFSCMELKVRREPSVRYYEWEANEGAAELLVPMGLLLPQIRSNYSLLKKWKDFYYFKEELASYYNVSEAVISFRFESLKYEIDQYINGTEIEDIKILSHTAQSRFGINVKSLNDIGIEVLNADYEKAKPFPINYGVLNIWQ